MHQFRRRSNARFDTQSEKEPRKHAEVAQGQQPKDELDPELPVLARKLGIPYLTLLPRKLPQSLRTLLTPNWHKSCIVIL